MESIEDLKELTKELALEIKNEEKGKYWYFLTHILDHITSYTALIDKDGNLIYVNQSTIEHAINDLNLDITKHIGEPCKELGFCDRICKNCAIHKSFKEGRVIVSTYTCPRSNTTSKLVCVPLKYNGISGVIVMISDIRE